MTNTELTGSDLEDIDREAIDEEMADWEDEQKEWTKDFSFLPGSRKNAPTRFAFYEKETLPQEKLFVLDEDYRDKRDQGVPGYVPLVPVHFYVNGMGPFPDEQTAMAVAGGMGLLTPQMLPQTDPMTGMQIPPSVPPPITPKPSFWAVLSGMNVMGLQGLPQFKDGWSLFKFHSHDYKRLLEDYGKRIEAIA